jgi:UDP-N-acetylglucosamine 2-epimerase (non-hydrolysing)
MKVMTVMGTRPEIIKLSRIMPLLDKHFDHTIVFTNQNFSPEMSSIFFKDMKVRKADYNLKIKTGQYGLEVSDIIKKSHDVMIKEKPDLLLLLGDVNSGLSSLSAANLGIKIAHIEAGMRSYDSRMPEERNRKIIDHLSSVNMVYTYNSKQNLIREDIHSRSIYVVGNPIVEVLSHNVDRIEKSDILNHLDLTNKEYILVTSHRSENVDDPETLKQIFKGLGEVYTKFQKLIIYPMHPRTSSKLINQKIPKGIKIIPPVGFFEFSKLEKYAFCIITDSGTVSEDASFFKTPCVTLRESTERPELIEIGSTILSGLNAQKLVDSVMTITSSDKNWDWQKALGDGSTSQKVVNILQGKIFETKL